MKGGAASSRSRPNGCGPGPCRPVRSGRPAHPVGPDKAGRTNRTDLRAIVSPDQHIGLSGRDRFARATHRRFVASSPAADGLADRLRALPRRGRRDNHGADDPGVGALLERSSERDRRQRRRDGPELRQPEPFEGGPDRRFVSRAAAGHVAGALASLVRNGNLIHIEIRLPDGRVVASEADGLAGTRAPITADFSTALAGTIAPAILDEGQPQRGWHGARDVVTAARVSAGQHRWHRSCRRRRLARR